MVEYEDLENNGYDSNDTVVSKYFLNSSSLKPLNHGSNDTHELYGVETEDGVFRMDIFINKYSTAGIEWKWSITLNYDFQSSTSTIAMFHDFESFHDKNAEHRHKRGCSVNKDKVAGETSDTETKETGDKETDGSTNVSTNLKTHRYSNNSLVKKNGRVPFFFKWIKTAVVDGVTQNITATSNIDTFAISIPQGEQIYYDPSIGVEQDGFEAYNSYLGSFGEILQVVFSPMYVTIFVASALTASVVGLTLLKRKKHKAPLFTQTLHI